MYETLQVVLMILWLKTIDWKDNTEKSAFTFGLGPFDFFNPT